jgi:hypothetical protein
MEKIVEIQRIIGKLGEKAEAIYENDKQNLDVLPCAAYYENRENDGL